MVESVMFHQQAMLKVIKLLKLTSCSVTGPRGIGKSYFLINLPGSYDEHKELHLPRPTQFVRFDCRNRRMEVIHSAGGEPDCTTEPTKHDDADTVFSRLQQMCDPNKRVVCLMDHFEEAVSDRKFYPLEFFIRLEALEGEAFRLVIATREGLTKHFHKSYDEDEFAAAERGLRPLVGKLYSIPLALVQPAEAAGYVKEFAEQEGLEFIASDKAKVEALCRIAGRYPLFLDHLMKMVYSSFSDPPSFDVEKIKKRFRLEVEDIYDSIWRDLDEKQQQTLYKLVTMPNQLSAADKLRLNQLELLALTAPQNEDAHWEIFSESFSEFVRMKEVAMPGPVARAPAREPGFRTDLSFLAGLFMLWVILFAALSVATKYLALSPLLPLLSLVPWIIYYVIWIVRSTKKGGPESRSHF